ncbi:MAG: hypothetical protein GX793_02980 [Bacteroidales bacterium]|jgi:hypothetical protein|nr:hypothetical protein [Bacteroidales bacterium]MCK9500039.1 hypothetical protein [Bacteroidales bacterium]MDY0314058.1 hypothetical protein [Bacteroidales bacterium]NLB86007.1 hypothetical protein [Bacteroidales bacterium]
MKKLILILIPAMMLVMACNNAEKKNDENAEKKSEFAECTQDKLTVDFLLDNLEDYIDEEVNVCGKCTHICEHGGRNIFLASKDDLDLVIFGRADEELGSFDEDLVGENVNLKGILRAVEVEAGEEVETHHDLEVRYYLEVSEAKICCCDGQKDENHKCCGGKHKHQD